MRAHIFNAVKQTRHIEYRDIRQKRDLGRCVLHDKRNIAVLAGLQQLSVTTQNTIGIDLNPHLSAAETIHFLRKALRIDLRDRVFRTGRAERPCIGLAALLACLTASCHNSSKCQRQDGEDDLFQVPLMVSHLKSTDLKTTIFVISSRSFFVFHHTFPLYPSRARLIAGI